MGQIIDEKELKPEEKRTYCKHNKNTKSDVINYAKLYDQLHSCDLKNT